MLTITQTKPPQQRAVGDYIGVNFDVVSDVSLIGQTIIVDPALWLQIAPETAGTKPANNYFTTLYPSGAGNIDMQFFGDEQKQNFRVNLKNTNAFKFTLTIWFVLRADGQNWNSQSVINTTQSFENAGGIYSSGDRFFAARVYANDASAVFSMSMSARHWCENDKFEFQSFNGVSINDFEFNPNSDLTIDFSIDTDTFDNINSGYTVGIYRTDNISNAGVFTDDNELHLGYVAGLGNISSNDFPITAFKDVVPIVEYDIGLYRGRVVIDAGHFDENGRYVIYVVYRLNGEYYSCRTRVLSPVGTASFGDVTCYASINGVQYNTCCLLNVPPHVNLTVCNQMDAVSYNASLFTNGQSGSYDDNLLNVRAWLMDVPPLTTTPLITGTNYEPDENGCVTIKVKPEWTGTEKYLVFNYSFEVDGEPQIIQSYFKFTVSDDDGINMDSLVDANGDPVTFTCDDNGQLTACFSTVDSNHIFIAELVLNDVPVDAILSADANFAGGDACVTVDVDALDYGLVHCLNLAAIPTTIPIQPPNVICNCTGFDITARQRVIINNGTNATISLYMSSAYFVANPAASVIVTAYHAGGNDVIPLDVSVLNAGNVVLNNFIVPSDSVIGVAYEIDIVLADGCTYFQTFQIQTSGNVGSQTADLTTVFDACDNIPTVPPPCNNYASVSAYCDTETGGIEPEFDLITTGGATVDTETREYSIDGGVNWLPVSGQIMATSALIRYTVTFTNCPPIVAQTEIDCVDLVCDNSPAIKLDYDINLNTLLPTNVGLYSSPILAQNFEYSLDDGATWTPVTGAIDVSALLAGENVIVRLAPTYSDGCPQITVVEVWTKGVTSVECDYSNFALECEHLGNEIFTADFIGCDLPEILNDPSVLSLDQREYSLNNGATWLPYTGDVQTTADVVLFKWTIQFENCDPVVLVAACVKPCNPCVVEFPDTFDVRIVNTVQMEYVGCITWCDDTLCTTPPEAGTGLTVTSCLTS